MSVNKFNEKYTTLEIDENVDAKTGIAEFRQLKFQNDELDGKATKSCIFLKGKLCGVHEARPTQCRTYPFWSHKLSSQEIYENERLRCEGIDNTVSMGFDGKPSGSGTLVSPEEVTVNAMIQMVDIEEKGVYTYEEAKVLIEGLDDEIKFEFEMEITGLGDVDDDKDNAD